MKIHTPHDETAVLNPLPRMPQVAELHALVARSGRIVVIRRIEPANRKSVVAGNQALDIAAHGVLDAESLYTFCGAISVELVGVGRDVPCLSRHFQKFAFPRERVEQFVSRCRGRDERDDRRVMFGVDGKKAHHFPIFHAGHFSAFLNANSP